ncbi:hypothetical protein [Methanohalophilus halophilus]|nr:hypothetical protein [Methanohalophilus halophilus]RNI09588.1 hypothetical protein EFE40_02690 [Methanohalophilus halophilus]SDW48342.1 hypothetical protein SAMN04515625_1002 [Methanohalophilus halophilus]
MAVIGFSWELYTRRMDQSKNSNPALVAFIIFWLQVGLIYLTTSLHMIANYTNWHSMDLLLYKVSLVPFAFLTVPVVFFVIYIMIGNKLASGSFSAIFFLVGGFYLNIFNNNVTNIPAHTEWASIFIQEGGIAPYVYIFGIFVIPTAMILGVMFLLLIRKLPKRRKYNITTSLLATSFVIDCILVDMFTTSISMHAGLRIFILTGIVLCYLAYFPPLAVKDRLGINEIEIEESPTSKLDI